MGPFQNYLPPSLAKLSAVLLHAAFGWRSSYTWRVHAFLIVITLTVKTLRKISITNAKSLFFFSIQNDLVSGLGRHKTNLQRPTRWLEGHAAAVRLTGKASDRMTWRWNRCPSCWSRSSAAWTGGQRTIGCSGPGSPWTCVWRYAATPWPPSATRTPCTKRSPTSRGTVGRMVPAKTPPSHCSSITSGTVFPANERATGRLKYGRLPNKTIILNGGQIPQIRSSTRYTSLLCKKKKTFEFMSSYTPKLKLNTLQILVLSRVDKVVSRENFFVGLGVKVIN